MGRGRTCLPRFFAEALGFSVRGNVAGRRLQGGMISNLFISLLTHVEAADEVSRGCQFFRGRGRVIMLELALIEFCFQAQTPFAVQNGFLLRVENAGASSLKTEIRCPGSGPHRGSWLFPRITDTAFFGHATERPFFHGVIEGKKGGSEFASVPH